jgi:hypothetical protein
MAWTTTDFGPIKGRTDTSVRRIIIESVYSILVYKQEQITSFSSPPKNIFPHFSLLIRHQLHVPFPSVSLSLPILIFPLLPPPVLSNISRCGYPATPSPACSQVLIPLLHRCVLLPVSFARSVIVNIVLVPHH